MTAAEELAKGWEEFWGAIDWPPELRDRARMAFYAGAAFLVHAEIAVCNRADLTDEQRAAIMDDFADWPARWFQMEYLRLTRREQRRSRRKKRM